MPQTSQKQIANQALGRRIQTGEILGVQLPVLHQPGQAPGIDTNADPVMMSVFLPVQICNSVRLNGVRACEGHTHSSSGTCQCMAIAVRISGAVNGNEGQFRYSAKNAEWRR